MQTRLQSFAGSHWQTIVSVVAVLAVLSAVLLPGLGSLVPTSSVFEQPGYLGVNNKQQLVEEISFAPLKLVQAAAVKVDEGNTVLLRLASVGVALVATFVFFAVLRIWHTRRIALLTMLLFISSSYVLHAARFAGQDVLYLTAIPTLLLIGTWLKSKKKVNRMPIAAGLLALLLYLPGLWLLIFAAAAAFYKRLWLAWKFVGVRTRLISAISFLLLLSPLIYSFVRYPRQIGGWLGLPGTAELSPAILLSNLKEIPLSLFVNGPNNPASWLLGTPVFDVFTLAMMLVGIYAYIRGHHPLRARLLGGFGFLAVALIMLGGMVSLTLLLPLFYLAVAAGLARMLQSWFAVFPRNPYARTLGLIVLTAATLLASSYHLQRYYIAWPNAPETREILGNRSGDR